MKTLECLAYRLALIVFVGISIAPAKADNPINLEEAVRIALGAEDPTVARYQAQAAALDDKAVADGQLADPELRISLVNWPTDSFSFDQEPMTQIQIGVVQKYPQGNTLRYQRLRREAESAGARARASLQELQIVNGGAKLVHRGGVKLGHSAVGSLST